MLQGHGDDSYKYSKEIRANFSTNVWYGGKSEALKSHLFNIWDKIHSYPEANAESLCELIAEKQNLTTDNVLVTNGATEAFYLIAQAYYQQKSTIVIPTFAEYEDACVVNKHDITFVNWSELSESTKFSSDLIWICNPNNPTGSIIEEIAFCKLLDFHPNSVFVLDEAYIDFTSSINSFSKLLEKYSNLILVKSLTKNFCIPGLRLGYLLANKALVQKIQFYKAPWSVNSIAIEAGKFILSRESDFLPPIKTYESNKSILTDKINNLSGFKIIDSKSSYFLVQLEEKSAKELKNYLIEHHGILIRDASNFRGLDSSYFRIACLDSVKNDLLIYALTQWIKL